MSEEKKFEDYFKLVKHKLPYWDELPEIDLYMDQVVALMDKYLSFHKLSEGDSILTHSMVNNYVKLGIMPAPVKKKYSREHIAYLIIICSLKQALPISDIKKLIDIRVKRTSIEETLNFFSDLYDSTFNTIIAILHFKKINKFLRFYDKKILPNLGSILSIYFLLYLFLLFEKLHIYFHLNL